MKCTLKSEPLLNELRVRLDANNHTDSMPLIREIVFRKQTFNINTQAFALAIAILISEHCGDFIEFPHLAIGGDYAEAIRTILGQQVNVSPVDGQAEIQSAAKSACISRMHHSSQMPNLSRSHWRSSTVGTMWAGYWYHRIQNN